MQDLFSLVQYILSLIAMVCPNLGSGRDELGWLNALESSVESKYTWHVKYSSCDILDIIQKCLSSLFRTKDVFDLLCQPVPCALLIIDAVRVYFAVGANTSLKYFSKYLTWDIQVHTTEVYNQIKSLRPWILHLVSYNMHYRACSSSFLSPAALSWQIVTFLKKNGNENSKTHKYMIKCIYILYNKRRQF